MKRCVFTGLMFYFCGCDIAIESPNIGDRYLSVDFITSRELLRPVGATFTVSVGAGPTLLSPVSGKATVEMEFYPDRMPESVYFIYASDPDHGLLTSQTPLAAAFVVRVPDHQGPGQSNLFLVTARHAVDPRWARCAEKNPESIELQLNRRIGGVGYETVQLQSGSKSTFFTSSDPTVDLALIPLDETVIANFRDYKLLGIPSDDLLTSTDLPLLHEDMSVRTAGYPASFAQGQVRYLTRNVGSIAEMHDDVTEVRCAAYDPELAQNQEVQNEIEPTLRRLWFINADAAAGFMGAPVFVDLERVAGQGRRRVLLGAQSDNRSQRGRLGVTPSYLLRDLIRSAPWKKPSDQKYQPGSTKTGDRSCKDNSGIASVVTSRRLHATKKVD